MNMTLGNAIDNYRRHLQARNRAESTIQNSIQPLRFLYRAVGDIQIRHLRPQHIDRMFQGKTWSVSTRNLYIGYLRRFTAHARRQGWMPRDEDPMDGWEIDRVPRKEYLRVPVERFGELMDATDHPRDRIVIALGLFTFCRSSEVSTIRVRDLDFGRNEVEVFRWKTSQPDTMPMSSELKAELLRWFAYYEHRMGETLHSNWLVAPALGPVVLSNSPVNGRFEKVTDEQRIKPEDKMGHPYAPVQRALAALGYDTHQTGGHTLRRSGARAWFDTLRADGYDGALKRVASMLGHADTRVTERYLGLGIERMQRNEMLAGKPMFPSMATQHTLVRLVGE